MNSMHQDTFYVTSYYSTLLTAEKMPGISEDVRCCENRRCSLYCCMLSPWRLEQLFTQDSVAALQLTVWWSVYQKDYCEMLAGKSNPETKHSVKPLTTAHSRPLAQVKLSDSISKHSLLKQMYTLTGTNIRSAKNKTLNYFSLFPLAILNGHIKTSQFSSFWMKANNMTSTCFLHLITKKNTTYLHFFYI